MKKYSKEMIQELAQGEDRGAEAALMLASILQPPPKTDKGVPVFARGAKIAEGRTLGGTKRCTMEGCRGIRIAVRWKTGKLTWPCSKGMSRSKKGWRIL